MSNSYYIGAAKFEAKALSSGLYIVATPIGNLQDITLRALETLAAADIILCEDTRVSGKLLERYQIQKPLWSYHSHNAKAQHEKILQKLREGSAIALVSDAGVPLISDPGSELIALLLAENIPLTSLPGASATLTALSLSGFEFNAFHFAGFLPQKEKARREVLEQNKNIAAAVLYFESPHRILDTLLEIDRIMPERKIAAARELTKIYEEVLRGTAKEIHLTLSARPAVKGEFVVMIDAAPPAVFQVDEIEVAARSLLKEHAISRAAQMLAKDFNQKRDDMYALLLKLKNENE